MTGVTVATAVAKNGTPLGFTANSFASVSLSPPLLLVCPARQLSCFAEFNACERFAINVLADNQRDIANRFASFRGDRFANLAWRACPVTKAPLIEGAAAVFSCATRQRVPAGDHIVLIGEALAFAATRAPALGYADGGYFTRALERRANELGQDARKLRVGIVVERGGRALMMPAANDEAGLTLPQVEVGQHTGALAALRRHLGELGLEVNIGSVYSVVEDAQSGAHSIYYRGDGLTNATGGGEYCAVESLAELAAPHLRSMLSRYCLEFQNGNFGLYIGDQAAGDVHRAKA